MTLINQKRFKIPVFKFLLMVQLLLRKIEKKFYLNATKFFVFEVSGLILIDFFLAQKDFFR